VNHAVHGAGGVVADVCGMDVGARVVRVAVGLPASTTRVVGPHGGAF
jgi:hypothetical protein